MSLFSALNTGITGLGTNGMSMSVIGDNISNLNTVGYKGSTAEFQDLILQQLGGGKGQLGLGAFTAKVQQVFGQGAIENSSNVSDLAIDGKGFFVVQNDDGGEFYSRAGQFRADTDGNLVNMNGLKLQGYGVNVDGSLNASVGDLNISTAPIPGAPTTTVPMEANLNPGDGPYVGAPTIDPVTGTFADVSNAADFLSSTVVTDSLGNSHDVTLAWYQTGSNTWDFVAYVDGGEIGLADEVPSEIATGTLEFDGAGALDTVASTTTSSAITFDGANAQTIGFDFGIATTDTGSITMFGDSPSAISSIDPDGNGSGSLSYWDMSTDGTITGIYSNGETRSLGQVVLANFQAEGNLSRVGHNLWGATRESGQAVVGAAGTGGTGSVHAYALEMSNVDLEKQFVKMIQSQKGYQASARVVSSVDDLLQELMQMV